MRAGTTLLVSALVAAAAPAAAQSCGGPGVPDGPMRLYDRSWIRSGAVFYGADPSGVFRMRLGSNAIEPIGDHAGRPPDNFRMSPNKRWLQYDNTGSGAHWLYNVANGREHRIGSPAMDMFNQAFSPDETRFAWMEGQGGERRLVHLDLIDFETRTIRLLGAPDPKAVFFDLAWSAKDGGITYGWRDAEREEFFSVDPATGVSKSMEMGREFQADEYLESYYLLGKGSAPATFAALDSAPAVKDSIALQGRASVRYENRKIVVAIPGKRPRTIAEIPPDCGPSLRLLDAFDGRYVLYRMNGVYWVYGVRENRKAILYRGEGSLEW